MARLLLLLLVPALVGALDTPAGWVRMEGRTPLWAQATSSWLKGERATSDIKFVTALQVDQERRDMLEKVFWEVSDPDHAKYGQHLSMSDITELLAVPEERAERVRQYFVQAGATEATVSPNRDYITVRMHAAKAEVALNTRLHHFNHKESTHTKIIRSTTGYSLPASIASDVIMVGELLQFPWVRSKSLRGLKGSETSWPNDCSSSSCDGLVTPAVLQERYKLPAASADSETDSQNSMAVAEFQGQYYKDSDLSKFSSSCNRDVTVAVNVGANENSAGVESELDIEYIKSVAPSVPLTVVYNAQYSLLDWANQITSLENSPYVHSVSYGNDEAQQSSTEYMFTCNTAFMKAGARGLSILFASGDQGVCGREGCGWFSWNKKFHPDFPAASPYITAVGGTDFKDAGVIGEETTWSAGGGGFSNTFGVPDYQKAAVEAYLQNADANLPNQKYWNATGRGYPDIAALGGQKNSYCVATSGRFEGVAGTSASCPVAAGVFARLNGLRLAAGKSPMGFLNPFIYKNPSGFQDVQSGKNDEGKGAGFTAVKGWDPATGYGTPNYEALAELAMSSSASIVV